MRIVLLVHRYLGVLVGLLMVLWCLSGFVMMYQGYPRLTPADRLQGLAPLRLDAAADTTASRPLPDEAVLRGFRIEMLAGRPVLLAQEGFSAARLIDLQSGRRIERVDSAAALKVAADYAAGHALAARPVDLGLINDDQWTVEGAARRGPVYHIRLNDPAGTELYVAARTGEAVQVTTRRTRFWSYLGAVPHWLYLTTLRRNAALWDQIVVWTSLAGVFLTLVGAYIGIARFRRYPTGRWSPYRGWFYWHHVLGLFFGLLTLTWIASGLFTMNPWGFLDTPVGLAQRGRLAGTITGAQVKRFLAVAPGITASTVGAPAGATAAPVQLQAAPLAGRLFVMEVMRDGSSRRLNAAGAAQPLTQAELTQVLAAVGGPPIARLTRLDRPDAYYYDSYQHPVTLPVYREQLAGPGAITFYIDARTGRIVDALDDVARQSRWLRTGLHDFDFTALLRRRPVWDIVVLLLLSGVTAGCITGAWMAILRVIRDVRHLSAAIGSRTRTRRTRPGAPAPLRRERRGPGSLPRDPA
jgi:hypothetical protein